jgi:ABC-type lipoprotein export system ATPase subunit
VSHVIAAEDLFHLYGAPFGDVAALRGLSLAVEEGETVAVLGPSGSGKSTLLGLCMGQMRPSSGELTVLGRSFTHARRREVARLRRDSVGVVRQHYHRALPPQLSVEEIVAMPLRLRGVYGREARGRAADLLAQVGLGDRASARTAELSGGEQQRVAICAALVKKPQLVLADEPTGELDAAATELVTDLLIGLSRETGAAALIVTHDPVVASAADRTIHIRDGRLAAEGTESPVLIIDEQGWLRLPRRVRDEAGLSRRVRARSSWGRVELLAEDVRPRTSEPPPAPRPTPTEKRYAAEIALDRIDKSFASGTVLAGFSRTFAPEQLHVLAGPSGSGKTTVLNLVAGLERPDAGEIWVAGTRVDPLGPEEAAALRRRLVGYVSQHSTLVDFLSARENVELALTLRGFSDTDARSAAARWLAWVGLERLADRRADRLSGGEARRVALARALAPGPRVLLADEPTAHLDRVTGRLVIRLLKEAAASGTTVIAASHDPDVATAADTTLVLGAAMRAA